MRARNIKPGFFKNADLIELEPLTRILFAGLWCMADREGRLLDRPKQIKIELLPGDNCDINAMLKDLALTGFIIRYQANNSQYIQINHFLKHQNPHVNEPVSEIPARSQNSTSTVPAPCQNSTSTVPAPGQNSTSTVPARLIPDSLIPDSLIPDSPLPLPGDVEAVASIVPETSVSETESAGKSPGTPQCPHREIRLLYSTILPELPQIEWNEDRATQLKARWKEKAERQALSWWESFFRLVRECAWLMGENDKGWMADLEWLTRKKNLPKVLDGKYKVRSRESPLNGVVSQITQKSLQNIQRFRENERKNHGGA